MLDADRWWEGRRQWDTIAASCSNLARYSQGVNIKHHASRLLVRTPYCPEAMHCQKVNLKLICVPLRVGSVGSREGLDHPPHPLGELGDVQWHRTAFLRRVKGPMTDTFGVLC